MSWKLTCRAAADGSGDVLCDVCDASTAETGYGALQAQWRDGEAEGMRLCRTCFNFAMSTLKRARWVNHMFDDDEPEQS